MEATDRRVLHPPEDFTPFTPTPKHPSRAVAGLLLAAHRHEDFSVLDSDRVRVPSASTPGLGYTVNLRVGNGGTCTCPFWTFGDAKSGHRANDKHLVAAEFVVLFRRAAPGASYRIEERHDSRFGTFFDVLEFVPEGFEALDWGEAPDWRPEKVVRHERKVSTALSFEGALWEVIELMQDRILEAGE